MIIHCICIVLIMYVFKKNGRKNGLKTRKLLKRPKQIGKAQPIEKVTNTKKITKKKMFVLKIYLSINLTSNFFFSI